MIEEYKLGPWLPDATDHRNPGLEICTGLIPAPGGYQPANGPDVALADLDAPALSAAMFERADGTRVVVAATAGDLHTVINGTVADSSLTLTLTGPVKFERFGPSIYATSKEGTWYLDDIETDTTFAAAGWTIPKGLGIAQIGDFLFMGNLTDTDASDQPYRIRWSPFNNPQGTWATNIGTQSDAVDMPQNLGRVQAITGGTTGLIFQRNGISRIYYTGGGSVFGKDIIDEQRGCVAPYSVVKVGESSYFLSDDGFFVTEGTSARSISRGRVWQWFLENSDQVYNESVHGAVDWPNRCVAWSVMSSSGSVAGLLLYNWETEWWGYLNQSVDWAFASGQDGLSLEQVAALYPDLDAMPISLDSPQFAARGRTLSAFIGGELRNFTGTTLAAQVQTGEYQPAPGYRTFVRAVTPLITNDSENTTVTLEGRDKQNSDFRIDADVPMGPLGYCPFNFDARYFRVTINIPEGADWRDAYGFSMDFGRGGDK